MDTKNLCPAASWQTQLPLSRKERERSGWNRKGISAKAQDNNWSSLTFCIWIKRFNFCLRYSFCSQTLSQPHKSLSNVFILARENNVPFCFFSWSDLQCSHCLEYPWRNETNLLRDWKAQLTLTSCGQLLPALSQNKAPEISSCYTEAAGFDKRVATPSAGGR